MFFEPLVYETIGAAFFLLCFIDCNVPNASHYTKLDAPSQLGLHPAIKIKL